MSGVQEPDVEPALCEGQAMNLICKVFGHRDVVQWLISARGNREDFQCVRCWNHAGSRPLPAPADFQPIISEAQMPVFVWEKMVSAGKIKDRGRP